MTDNLSPWFFDEKPVHVGVYEQGTEDDQGEIIEGLFSYWDGEHWSLVGDTPNDAFENRKQIAKSGYQNEPWRGILK